MNGVRLKQKKKVQSEVMMLLSKPPDCIKGEISRSLTACEELPERCPRTSKESTGIHKKIARVLTNTLFMGGN